MALSPLKKSVNSLKTNCFHSSLLYMTQTWSNLLLQFLKEKEVTSIIIQSFSTSFEIDFFKFAIHLAATNSKSTFFSDANSATEIIASILEMGEIKRCSNVKIVIMTGIQKRLPVEEISKWLEIQPMGRKITSKIRGRDSWIFTIVIVTSLPSSKTLEKCSIT